MTRSRVTVAAGPARTVTQIQVKPAGGPGPATPPAAAPEKPPALEAALAGHSDSGGRGGLGGPARARPGAAAGAAGSVTVPKAHRLSANGPDKLAQSRISERRRATVTAASRVGVGRGRGSGPGRSGPSRDGTTKDTMLSPQVLAWPAAASRAWLTE